MAGPVGAGEETGALPGLGEVTGTGVALAGAGWGLGSGTCSAGAMRSAANAVHSALGRLAGVVPLGMAAWHAACTAAVPTEQGCMRWFLRGAHVSLR